MKQFSFPPKNLDTSHAMSRSNHAKPCWRHLHLLHRRLSFKLSKMCFFFSNSEDLILWMKSDHHQSFFCPCTSRSNHAKPGWRHLHSLKNMQFSKHLKFLIVCDHHQRFFCPCSLVSGVFRVIGCSRPWRPPTNYGQKIGHPEPLFVILKPLNSNYGH